MPPVRPNRVARGLATTLFLALASLLLPPGSAHAIDFVLVWDDLDENPSFDPDGTRLMAIAAAAAARWERLIVSPGEHTVDVSWSYLDSGQLGLWKFDPFGNNNLYFNANASWFFDPSPNEDSEFDFGSPLDLFSGPGSELVVSDENSYLYFDRATPPDMLETAYFGNGISGSARNDTDLLSVILHEMGHELGIAGDEFSGRYAIYPHHVNGVQNLEVIEENLEGSNYGEEHGHLAPPDALMSPNGPSGMRTLPSAVDVLAAARDSGYTQVNLVRKFSGIDGAYDDPLVWIGGRVPDSSDHVSIMHGGTVTVDSPETADSLAIGRNSTLAFSNGGDLAIDHELWVDEFSSIQIPFGSVLSADLLITEENARITLAGGELALTTGTVPQFARIEGRGRFTMNGGFEVGDGGGIRAAGGDLRLTGPGSLRLLGGAIGAVDGNVGMELPFAAGSTGVVVVGEGRSFTALADLTVPTGVELRLRGSPSNPAIVNSIGSGVDLTIRNLDVGFDNSTPYAAQITASTVTLAGSVHLDGDLTLSSPLGTTLSAVSIFGGGTLVQDGDISVQGGVSAIAADDFDWGNSTAAEVNSIVISPNAELRLRSGSLGSSSNQFRGEIQIDSGVLDVGSLASGSWSLARPQVRGGVTIPGGTLAMIHSGAADPVVRGDAFSVNDFLLVSGGDAWIEADMTVTPFGDVFVFGNSRLFLAGTTTMNGGSWGGDTLVQRGDIEVVGDTTIAMDEFDWGNSLGTVLDTLAVRSGATFTVDSPGTGDPTNPFRGHMLLEGGELVVNTNAGWSLPAGGLFSRAGTLEMVNDGAVPRIAGQDLEIGGEVLVTGGLARIDSNLSLLADSRVEIGPGATLETTGSNLYRGSVVGDGTLEHRGSTILTSSTPYAISNFVQAGELRSLAFGGEATLATQSLLFDSAGTNTLTTDLRIRGIATVEPGAVFTGDGALIVDDRGSLGGSGVIGVDVVNEGVLSPGASPGHLQIAGDYTQTGLLRIELAGPTTRDYDRVSFLGHAQLGGTLELILSNGYLPAPGSEFEFLRFSRLGADGAFDEIRLPDVGANGFWDLSALYTDGRATFVPEPGTFALVALGLAALRRRR